MAPEVSRAMVSIASSPNALVSQVPSASEEESLCPEPVLSRLTRHTIAPGDTLDSIAQQYNLIPATLMGFNPVLRNGSVPVGTEIVIPPYNGIQVEVPSGTTWRNLAEIYNIRADALFEVNGCQAEVPNVVFVPGVNWSPAETTTTSPGTISNPLTGYPLPEIAPILSAYGWQLDPTSGEVIFRSGVDLQADAGTPVLAVGEGTIAFAGEQGDYGNLVVINHSQGLQTRYAQLDSISVETGQRIQAGTQIGTVGSTGSVTSPQLHFEVRSNSELGWVAEDPGEYVQNIRTAQQLR
ncbi:MAG: M23 family metallopeptidase [Cyanobacteria bacterium CRU_2_1]|nr:M23 family metallopeptidase [Cyanobacteria bacterium RU_5_0]NJR59860.1 M23 family metallopeptidase [Cyanobacteria bacterium CRU_2_1]